MTTENLSTLKIHKLSQEQYDRELAAGRIDENAIYLTPDEDYDIDLEGYATIDQLNEKENKIFKRPDEPLDAHTGALWIDTDEGPTGGGSGSTDIIGISVSWNDIKDKPFYEEGRQIISWDGNTEGLESFERSGLFLYRVSDETPSYEELQNHIMTIIDQGQYWSGTESIYNEGDSVDLGVMVVINYENDNLLGSDGSRVSTGTYFAKPAEDIYVTSLVYGESTVKPLDEKFIPSTVARISDIPTDYLTELPEDLARKSDIPTDYLKEVPSEYVTETELAAAIKLKNLIDGEGQGSIKSAGAISASGEYSFAEGPGTMATGFASHAEGSATVASGDFSHAEGGGAYAEGEFAHAEGENTRAIGQHSHAEGQNTVAAGADSHVQGRFNVRDNSNLYAHIVGNGADNNNRKNIHTVDWSGNAWFAGDVYVHSTSGINKDTGSKKLVAEPKNPVVDDLLIYNGSGWSKISKAQLIADIIAALPPAEEGKF